MKPTFLVAGQAAAAAGRTRGWRALFILLILLCAAGARAQVPAWQQAVLGFSPTGAAGAGALVQGTALNADGDVFITGFFTGDITIGRTRLVNRGRQDMFVAKWSRARNTWAWAVSGGGLDYDQGAGIAVSGPNVYVTGYFHSTAGVRLAGRALVGRGAADMFLVKYLDWGTRAIPAWLVTGGGAGYDEGTNVAVAGSRVYVTGQFAPTDYHAPSVVARIAGTSLPGSKGRDPQDADMFLARYEDQGLTVADGWAVSGGGGHSYERSYGLAVRGADVYVAGCYGGVLALDRSATFAGVTLPGTGNTSLFLAKYTDLGLSAGNGWAVSGGRTVNASSGVTVGSAIALSYPNVYVTGSTTIDQRPTIAGTPLAGRGDFDMFLAKYVDLGKSVREGWAVSGGGTGMDGGNGIVARGRNVYVAGHTLKSSNIRVAGTALPGGGFRTAFVAKYTDQGAGFTERWALGSVVGDNCAFYSLALRDSTLYAAGSAGAARGRSTLPLTGGAAGLLVRLADEELTPFHPEPVQPAALAPYRPPAIPEIGAEDEAPVFPPFAPGRFTLRLLPGQHASGLTLTNALGQLVAAIPTPGSITTVDLSRYAPGMYTLRVVVEGQVVTRRVVE